ncbi:MAG: sulfatase-like hydrolase/transferase [Verrucomicrobiota bacterium]
MRRPNILIFCVDEMRADHLRCAGNSIVQTPNLDRLAARGTVFTNSYCNNPICMPARATMFTGLLPRDHGLRVNGQTLCRDLPTLPQTLADTGYRTHAAGKLHLTPWVPKIDPPQPQQFPECLQYWNAHQLDKFPTPYYGFESVDFVGGHTSYVYGPYLNWLEEHGGKREQLTPARAVTQPSGAPSCFKMSLPEELHYNRYIADSMIRLIEQSTQEGARPFFAWCSFPDPHCPIAPPKPYCDLYSPQEMPLPARRPGELDDLPSIYRRVLAGEVLPNGTDNRGVTDEHWREMIALTYGMVTHIDAEIGRVLDALERSGQADNTIIVFLSDHGDMMGDHGLLWKAFYTFRGCINIPTIVSAPGQPGGRQCDALIAQVDLFPSLLDLCSVPLPGSDWASKPTPFSRGAVRPLKTHPGHSWKGLLDGPLQSIRSTVVIENDDPTTGHQVRAIVTPTHRLAIYPGTDEGELFDLRDDPWELFNLWHRPEHADRRHALTAQLLADYARETPWFPVPPWNS